MTKQSPIRAEEKQPVSRFEEVLGLFGAVAIAIAGIIGSGIFFVIGIAAKDAGPAVILSLFLAGIVALFTAMSFASLGSKITKEGGEYQFVYIAFGKKIGFLSGILWIFATGIGGVTASLVFASYLNAIIPIGPPNVIAAVTCLILTLIDTAGLRFSSRVNIGLVIIKVGVLLLFVLLCLPLTNIANFGNFFEKGSSGIISSTFLIFFAYAGFGKITAVSEEVKNPQRTVPLAIILAISISTIIYLSAGFASVGVVGAEKLGSPEFAGAPFAYVLLTAGYPWAFYVISVGAMAATASVILIQILGNSRTIYAMVVNKQLPHFLGELHPSFRTPFRGELIAGMLMSIAALFLKRETVIVFTSLGILGYYSIINVAAMVLRKKEGRFRVPAAIPLLGAASGIFLIVYYLWTTYLP